MKTITINVSEETYRVFQEYAYRNDRTASELIRNAMEDYRRKYLGQDQSIFDQPPISAGKMLKDLTAEDDLLQEMIR